ncbi:MAG: glycosyltransferase family 2 protein, partial [Streptococcus sp.]|nr:glycosyltransferase family 2 protein [Streptococcus sp.]
FLDPDDYLEPCALELLAELQSRTQADMVSGKVEPTAHYHRFQNFHLDQLDLDQVKVYDKAKALTEMLYGDLVTVSACGKLYRKELLEKAPFPKGRIYEDLYVISEHLNQAQSVALYHLPIYHYYHRPGSITASAFTPKQYEFYEAIDHLKEVVNATYPESSELQEAIISRFFTGSLLIFTMIKDGDSVEFKRLQEKTRPYLPLVLKNARVSKKRRILYVLITKYPRLYYQFKKLKKS